MRKKFLEPHKIWLPAKEQCVGLRGNISYPNDHYRSALVPLSPTDHSVRVALPSYWGPGLAFHLPPQWGLSELKV